jgi:hypothetical protein
LVTDRLALELIAVGSLALLLAVFMSPAVETVAVLVTLEAALADTLTVSEIPVLAPAGRGPALLHVTVCPAAKQLHVSELPDTKPRPAGKVSVTVINPVVAAEPTFCTVIV